MSAIDRLLAMPRFADAGGDAYQPGLQRVRAVLDAMGQPERAYPVVHIGGTNGKGSTASMVSAILTAAGRRVGLHTSPHLLELGERMRIDGWPAPADWLEASAMRHERDFADAGASFFEATTALSFSYFAGAGVDIAIVEVGLGGRYDATNVVQPIASAVTSVGLDHTEILGATVEAIAAAKGAIARPGVPFLTMAEGTPLYVLRTAAEGAGAPFENVRASVDLRAAGASWWKLATPERDYGEVEIGLPGTHQAWNAALAVRLAEIAAPGLAALAVSTGLRDVVRLSGLRGRGEAFVVDPRVTLDVAHNADGWRAALDALHVPAGGRLHVLAGVMADKDAGALAGVLAGAGAIAFAVDLPSERALPAERLADVFRGSGVEVADAIGSAAEGLEWFRGRAGVGGRLLVTGSHVTVAETLRAVAAAGENEGTEGPL